MLRYRRRATRSIRGGGTGYALLGFVSYNGISDCRRMITTTSRIASSRGESVYDNILYLIYPAMFSAPRDQQIPPA